MDKVVVVGVVCYYSVWLGLFVVNLFKREGQE